MAPEVEAEAELERLILEQARDDAPFVRTSGTEWKLSLDSPVPKYGVGRVCGDLVGRDPWGLIDAAIDFGLDPTAVTYSGALVDAVPATPGLLSGGLIDTRKIPHGTAGGYQHHKCRMPCCTNAWAAYKRERRAAVRESAALRP